MFYRFRKNSVEFKLESLIKEFRFLPIIEVVENLDKAGKIPSIDFRVS